MFPDEIRIEALELSTRIGVPEEERALPQRLTANLLLIPETPFDALADRIENTVDYFQVARCVQEIARSSPRHLIETLVEEIAQTLLARFPLRAVEIELRKYILPDTAHVAVRIRREQ
jgi:dihydroneopterin aldolase